MRKSHRENTVGPWAEQKLQALEDYLCFYSTALKNQSFKFVYIDAFAGSPYSKVRSSRVTSEYSLFEIDDASGKEQEEFIEGSPLRALKFEDFFSQYYFFDRDKTRAKTLAGICDQHTNVSVQIGDCNPLVCDLVPSLKMSNIRGVAFLDPYGAHIEWNTLIELASTKNMEVIINFPVGMAINRLIRKESDDITENGIQQLNKFFGTKKWFDLAYSLGDEDILEFRAMTKNEGVRLILLKFYIERLEKLFGCVASPRLICNTKGSPLYYLIWAGPNPLGLKGAEYILNQGREDEKFNRLRSGSPKPSGQQRLV